MPLSTCVVYGSARRARQGIKAARFIMRQLELRDHEATLIDSEALQLPLLDRMYKEYEPGEAPETMEAIAEAFRKADGFIIVSAEYNHSIPAALKNLLDHFQKEYLYKPSGIVTYSAGPFGGVRGLANLRTILAELGAASIPSSFPVSRVQDAFDEDGGVRDTPYDEWVVKFLDEYEWYAEALRSARSKETCKNEIPVQQAMCRDQATGRA
jgi:NAD(P)H-dependent FMN reductase